MRRKPRDNLDKDNTKYDTLNLIFQVIYENISKLI